MSEKPTTVRNPITGDSYKFDDSGSKMAPQKFESSTLAVRNILNWSYIDASLHESKRTLPDSAEPSMPKKPSGYLSVSRCSTANELYFKRQEQRKLEATERLMDHPFNGIHSSSIPSFKDRFEQQKQLWFEEGRPPSNSHNLQSDPHKGREVKPLRRKKNDVAKSPGQVDMWDEKNMSTRPVKRPFTTRPRDSEIYQTAMRNKTKGVSGDDTIYWFETVAYTTPLYSSFTKDKIFPGSKPFSLDGTSACLNRSTESKPTNRSQRKQEKFRSSQGSRDHQDYPPSINPPTRQEPRLVQQNIRASPTAHRHQSSSHSSLHSPMRASANRSRSSTVSSTWFPKR